MNFLVDELKRHSCKMIAVTTIPTMGRSEYRSMFSGSFNLMGEDFVLVEDTYIRLQHIILIQFPQCNCKLNNPYR